MKLFFPLSVACALSVLSVSNSFAAVPTSKEIIDQLTNVKESQATPAKAIVIDSTKAVVLRSGELAYLSGVSYENAGRNFWAGYILTRPKLKQSQILPEFGGQSNTFKVYSALSKMQPVQLVEIESSGSGQGTLSGASDLVYFDGWKAKVIATAEFSSDPGRYSDKLGEEDCRTGGVLEEKLQVSLERKEIVKTTQSSNACKNAKISRKSEKIKILVP